MENVACSMLVGNLVSAILGMGQCASVYLGLSLGQKAALENPPYAIIIMLWLITF